MTPVRILAIVAAIAIVAGLGWVFYQKYAEIASYKQEISQLEKQQQSVQIKIDDFLAQLSLKDDYGYIEYLARKELGLIYPDEEKYIIVGDVE